MWESLGGLPLPFDLQRSSNVLQSVSAALLNRCQNLFGFGATPCVYILILWPIFFQKCTLRVAMGASNELDWSCDSGELPALGSPSSSSFGTLGKSLNLSDFLIEWRL